MSAENVDTKAKEKERVAAMWGLITNAVNFFAPQENEVAKDNVRRFLLSVAWHEGAFLQQRKQVPQGPGRSFFQFEATRAKEAVEYAQQREPNAKFLTALARVANCKTADLVAAAQAITNGKWPANNLLEELLGGSKANDLFAIYLTRIAFLKVPAPLGSGVGAHAEYWASYWKIVFDSSGPNTRPKLIARYQQEALQVAKLIPQLAPVFAAQFHSTAAMLREEASYFQNISRQLQQAAKLVEQRESAISTRSALHPRNVAVATFNGIIDTYHGNTLDIERVKAAGIAAIIHKATQGLTMKDRTYHERRLAAKQLGLLWGAYHYSSGDDAARQAKAFLDYAQPEKDEVIALDWEASITGSNMTQQQVREYVTLIFQSTGRWPLLYGGSLLREVVGSRPDPILANCPLWYSRYNDKPLGIPAKIWPDYTLWQYTDGTSGPEPRTTPGVSGADRNLFRGTLQQLRQQWPWGKVVS